MHSTSSRLNNGSRVQAMPRTAMGANLRAAGRTIPFRGRKVLVARSQKEEFNSNSISDASNITQIAGAVRTEADRFFKRYDFVSTGMGALAVTGYCFYRGQDFGTAISITVVSTIVALVINELTASDCN